MEVRTFPPGPSSALRSYIALRRNPLDFLTRMAREYGDIMHLQIGSRHDYLLNRPDYIQQVLLAPDGMIRSSARPLRRLLGRGVLTTTGEEHRAQRRQLQPLFHRQHLARWVEIIVEEAARTRTSWRPGSVVDMSAEMLALSQAVIVRLLLNIDSATDTRGLPPVLRTLVEMVNRNTFPSLGELVFPFPSRRVRLLTRSIAELDALLLPIITERRAGNGESSDMLSTMLQMRDETGQPSMTLSAIRDQIVTFISAGHETVGNALTWTWYLLAMHPEVEAELHAEVDGTLGGRTPTAADLPRLKFVEAVLKESMRLYPPVWVVARKTAADFALGDYIIPQGAYLQISPYVTQRDGRYFPDPDDFDPDRWTNADGRSDRAAYFPFAAGAHKCIGEGLAWTEAILAIAMLSQSWRMRATRPERRPRPEAGITVRPKGGMTMTVLARS